VFSVGEASSVKAFVEFVSEPIEPSVPKLPSNDPFALNRASRNTESSGRKA
jgi:hypothetical protein